MTQFLCVRQRSRRPIGTHMAAILNGTNYSPQMLFSAFVWLLVRFIVCVDLAANAAVALAIGFVYGMCALVQPYDYAGEQMFHTCVSQARFLRPRTEPKTKIGSRYRRIRKRALKILLLFLSFGCPPEKNQLVQGVKIQDWTENYCKRSMFVRATLARTGFFTSGTGPKTKP